MTSRVVLRATILALALAAGACQRTGKKVIAVIPKGNANIFWQTVHAGAVKAARELGVEIVWNGPPNETDISEQLQIVETMTNRHVDAIALAPADRKALVGAVERAADEKIPVVIYDSGIDTDRYVSFIATDNNAAGQLAGERMGKILHGKGEIVMLRTMPGSASTTAREDGFSNILQSRFPAVRIVDEQYGNSDAAESLKKAENMLTAHPQIDALFASSEIGTVGASQAIRARGESIKLIGFDWSPDLLNDLRAGRLDSLVVQDPFRMGYECVKAAVQALSGGHLPKRIDLPARLIDASNLDTPDVRALVSQDLKRYLN